MEKAIAMSPNTSPKGGVLQNDADADEGLDPSDSPYIEGNESDDDRGLIAMTSQWRTLNTFCL